MNSGELARMAGVTVRTLRHYHHVGLLPEPPRAGNGYRDYSAEDLLRLLRIKRATTAGVPLDRIRELLDHPRATTTVELLEHLDQELENQIARLTAQLDVVRRMRDGDFDPAVPTELVPVRQRGQELGLGAQVSDLDLDQAVLLLHLVGPTAASYLDATVSILAGSQLLPTVVDLAAQFRRIDDSTTADELQHLVDRCVKTLAPVVAELKSGALVPTVSTANLKILEQHRNDRLNSAQRATIDQIAGGLSR